VSSTTPLGAGSPASGTVSVAVACFTADLAAISEAPEAGRWELQATPEALAVWVTMAPEAVPEERFHAMLKWTAYPTSPPSVKFGDPNTGRVDVLRDWPTGGPMRPEAACLCVSYTAEGFGMHPEWVNSSAHRWDSRGNAVLKVVRWLQHDLDTTFAGRHA
jgi:hypothetical protein